MACMHGSVIEFRDRIHLRAKGGTSTALGIQ